MKLEKWNSPDFPADKIGNETVNDSIMRRINHLFRSNRLSNCYGFCLSFHLLRFQLRIFFLEFDTLASRNRLIDSEYRSIRMEENTYSYVVYL